jgi:hypothetical protein
MLDFYSKQKYIFEINPVSFFWAISPVALIETRT